MIASGGRLFRLRIPAHWPEPTHQNLSSFSSPSSLCALAVRLPISLMIPRRPVILTGRGRLQQIRGFVRGRRGEKAEGEEGTATDHVKKRTRSAMQLDRGLYLRYGGCHMPVMLGEVLEAFRSPHELHSFVDCTLGAGGHSAAVGDLKPIIEAHSELQLYVGMDVDPIAHDKARSRIEPLLGDDGSLKAYTCVKNFKYIKSVLADADENLLDNGVDGILMDLGMSSMQVDEAKRGFSVLEDGPLDMRMDPQASLKAEDILNSWPKAELARVLRDYGEESNWRFISERIIESRRNGGMHSTVQLVNLIRRSSATSGGRRGWIKTATRVFQALRIAVNDELRSLEEALYACFDCLSSGGRLVVISFHSLEDRNVKQAFLNLIHREVEGDGRASTDQGKKRADQSSLVRGRSGNILTKRPITPSLEEERFNGKCRSAKLRVIQKSFRS